MVTQTQSEVHLPRVAITFCTKCKWNLRAAYYAQELLQTFSESIGEVALIPTAGGIFTITLTHETSSTESTGQSEPTTTLLWDRKTEGFPETKELKSRFRNIIEPERNLGHVDRGLKKAKGEIESVDEKPKSNELNGQNGRIGETNDSTTLDNQKCLDCT